jgi:hypothetical protein
MTASIIHKFFTSRKVLADAEEYIGSPNRLWYDESSNTIRISNGSTPGGIAVCQTPISTDTGNSIIAGTDGGLYAGSVPVVKGTAILDFGQGSSTAQIVVTGVTSITEDSFVQCAVRVQATDQHSVDDLLYDPIQVSVSQLYAGSGFSIHGQMFNARANGTYIVNWTAA